MLSDIEIAQQTKIENIEEIAKKLNIQDYIELYGKTKAKIDYLKVDGSKKGKLILVTATSP